MTRPSISAGSVVGEPTLYVVSGWDSRSVYKNPTCWWLIDRNRADPDYPFLAGAVARCSSPEAAEAAKRLMEAT